MISIKKSKIIKPGQILCIGLKGPHLLKEEKKFIEEEEIFSVILFKKNIVSISQCYELCREIKSLNPSPLITIDREGGVVDRLKHLTPIGLRPSPKDLCSLSSLEKIKKSSYLLHQELRLLGIDVNFAPCLDVQEIKSKLFYSRLFGSTAQKVITKAGAFLSGAKKACVSCCVKHFPGHGAVTDDSHHTLPIDNRTFKHINNKQLVVFQSAINKGIDWIMTAHVLYTNLDPNYPATFSKKILDGILRKKMKFKGLIISDDMNMKAVSHFFNPPNNISKENITKPVICALQAGVDILLYSKTTPFLWTLPDFLSKSLKYKKLQRKYFHTKVQKAHTLKAKLLNQRKKTSLQSVRQAIKNTHQFLIHYK